MKFTAADLAATLSAAPEESYVRVVADWLAHGEVAPAGPALTRRPVIDADVDGVFEPKAVIYEAARRVAERHEKLPADWLNDRVKGLLPGGADRHAKVILDLPGITVSVPSPHYLLALKVQAARIDRDQDDIRFLARETGAKTADDVLRIAEQVIGSNRLLPKAQFIVQEMFPRDPAEPSPP